MSEELNKSNANIIETKDLGEGKKQVTFNMPASQYQDLFNNLQAAGVNAEGFKLGKGSVMNRFDPSTRSTYFGSEYTSNDYPYTQIFNSLPIDPHQKIRLAVELYFKEPIVGSVIDMMVDFSSSGFTNECDDVDVKKIFDRWCEEVNINELLEKIFLEYYRSGNVTIYRNKNNAKVKRKKKQKNSPDIDITEYQFPSNYTILNPMNVYINGSLFMNKVLIQLKVSNEMQYFLNSPDSPNNYLPDLPAEIWKDSKTGQMFMTLDENYVTRITRKRMDYERYASPFLERVFEPIMYKAKMRIMDMATIEGLINQLVTVTVGDKDYPATDEDLKAIAELFQTPSKAYTVFWNHTLQVKFHKPEGIDTLTAEKYKEVNDDIVAGLGISRSLLDGGSGGHSGGGMSATWVSTLSLIERLENARNKVKHWLESEYSRIAKENGFKTYPRVRFNKMNLREDTYIRDVLLAMYDRGLVDEEDILTETGRDFQSVIDMKKRNKKFSDLFLPPEQPFQGGQAGPNGGRPTGQPGKKMPNRKSTPEKNSGKPPKLRKATASISSKEEEYVNELVAQYGFIESESVAILNKHREENENTKKVAVTAALLSLFRNMATIGARYLQQIFDEEVAIYGDLDSISNAAVTKADLIYWNNSYVNKLAHDIETSIMAAIEDGTSIDDAVEGAFSSHRYRVAMIAESGAFESTRKAKIIGNQAAGNETATWMATIDEKTCAICRGLHGRQFAIADVPERPHANCRCDLEFS